MSLGQKKFGILPDGTRVDLFTLQNASGMKMEVIPYGCRIVSLWVPDKHGKSENIVLGHDTLEEYLLPGDYLGCVVGRYANRIAGAEFTLNEMCIRDRGYIHWEFKALCNFIRIFGAQQNPIHFLK